MSPEKNDGNKIHGPCVLIYVAPVGCAKFCLHPVGFSDITGMNFWNE